MSVSIEEALNGAGYDFSKEEDCLWLVGQTGTLEELVVRAEDLIEKFEDERNAKELADMQEEADRSDKEYKERWG